MSSGIKGTLLTSNGDEIREDGLLVIQVPNDWNGRVWAKTGCIFNKSDSASCATGDKAPYTLAEFGLHPSQSVHFYDASLVDGFNLPLLIEASGGCASTGCIEDVNQRCPPELRSGGGAACKSPCDVFKRAEYCCNEGLCGPTNYSELFKDLCPKAYSYPQDDTSSIFSCGAAGAQYYVTFCPPSTSYSALGNQH